MISAMNYSVFPSDNFKREAKRLSKKYPSLKADLKKMSFELEKNPSMGTPPGNNVFKIRLAVSSKGKGKSGGARVISLIKVIKSKVFLLSIYNKGEKDSISDKEIKSLTREFI
jgi:mRNA-degrading endonuclease RelE of RelBE toxin-antitoxin system